MAVEIKSIDAAEVRKRMGRIKGRFIAYEGIEGGDLVGSGGLYWEKGECWLWLDEVDMDRTHPVTVVRMAQRMLQKARQFGEKQVLAARDEAPCSERLLKMLGFELVARLPGFDEKEIWRKWLSSPPLQQ